MNTPHGIVVYSYKRCPFAMRVRMLLHEKNIPFITKEENLKDFSQELRDLHPKTTVPFLVHGSVNLHESSIINEYLEETFPHPQLMPLLPSERAQVRHWTLWCNQTFKHHVDHLKYGERRATKDQAEHSVKHLHEDLLKLETQLAQTTYLVGDDFSLADIHVMPFVRQLTKVTPGLEGLNHYGHTLTWLDKINQRPSFLKTMETLPQ